MRRKFLKISLFIGSLAVNGCAVLTIDVDVYKGALANHESVQNEQVAAMAMGAKPLLVELRYKLEEAECKKQEEGDSGNSGDARSARTKCPRSAQEAGKTSQFIPSGNLQSRDAQRINEILRLYEDASGQILRPLSEAAAHLLKRIEEANRLVRVQIRQLSEAERDKVATELARLTRLKRFQPSLQVPKNYERAVAAVQTTWEAAENTWQEAIRVLSSDDIRAQLKEFRNDAIWDVAWVAADLTSAEGLRRFLTGNSPDQLKIGTVKEFGTQLPILTQSKSLTPNDSEAVGAVLAQVLADKDRGPALAKQLSVAHGYASVNHAGDWFIAIYPTKELILQIDSEALEDIRRISNHLEAVESALGAGRPSKGLEKLIDEYLRADRSPARASELTRKKRELQDGLINFAQKVSVIANFDSLVRDREALDRHIFHASDRDKYVRVLQAVGNSILSQVDALRQAEAHRSELSRSRETEVMAIQNAEARSAVALNVIAVELRTKPDDFPGKQAIDKALRQGTNAVTEVITEIEKAIALGKKQAGSDNTGSASRPQVADLERWLRQVTQQSNERRTRIQIPENIQTRSLPRMDGDRVADAKDVLDVMLATLRYEHVAAVANPQHSEHAKNIAAAVELLYAYRSGMIHIRPAATYLRNSYPATILQQDSTASVWRNMLTDQGNRQIPFWDVFLGQKEEVKINQAIDKQFWQSVNQIRVSGAGRTNYAIAKDDVGNWYVKSYSSNPTDIIQSAKNLAMFSAGPAMGANFLARGGQRPSAAGTAPTGAPEVPTTRAARNTLALQFDRSSKRYEDQTLMTRSNLTGDIKSLNDKLKATFTGRGASPEDLKTIYSEVFSEPDAELLKKLSENKQPDGTQKTVNVLNAEIASGLRYVKNYRSQVQSKLTTNIAEDDNPDVQRKIGKTAGTQVKADIDRTFKDLLDRYIKERQSATGQYESTLLIINESAGL